MFAKIKSSNFIDALHLELVSHNDCALKGILKDEKGSVCSTLEREVPVSQSRVDWRGLDDLPYGKYVLELTQGAEKMKVHLVKRV